MALPKYLSVYVKKPGTSSYRVGKQASAGMSASQRAAAMRSSLNGGVQPARVSPVGNGNPIGGPPNSGPMGTNGTRLPGPTPIVLPPGKPYVPPVRPGAVAPVTPAGPSGPEVFFDPLSSTLWRSADGKEYNLPADSSGVNFLGGNLLKDSSMAKEAAFYYQQGNGKYQLDNALRPGFSKLDELSKRDAQGRTMGDLLGSQMVKQWTDKSDGEMASAAMRGIYDSGMREHTASNLATERSNAATDIDKQWGATAIADTQKGISDARQGWVGDWLQQFQDYYSLKVAQDTQNALNGVGGGGGDAPVSTPPGSPKPSAPVGGGGSTSTPVKSPVGTVAAGTRAPVLATGMLGQRAGGFDRSAVKGASTNTDTFLTVSQNGKLVQMRMSRMDDALLKAALRRPENASKLAPGWAWSGTSLGYKG